jgi:hypothetical protein
MVGDGKRGERMAVLKGDGGIVVENHMEYYVVVGVVSAVTMEIPVGGFDMYFDIAHPERLAHTDARVEKIRASIAIEDTSTFHNDGESVGSAKVTLQQLMLPDVL